MPLIILILIIVLASSVAINVIFSFYLITFFNINSFVHRRKRLQAFRLGVDWGVTLFSRFEEIDGKLIEVTGNTKPPRRTKAIRQEIKAGRWDIVLERYKKPINL